MKVVHLMAGLGAASGVANIARRFARVQRERGDAVEMLAPTFKWNPIYFGLAFALRAWWNTRTADEIWVHCSWTFPVWFGAFLARLFGKKLVVVPEGSFDPKRLHNHAGWKKRLVAPLDRWVLRRADEVLALCRDEIAWVKGFESTAKVRFEQVPIFLPKVGGGSKSEEVKGVAGRSLQALFLGRVEDPLKGVEFLERAVEELNQSFEHSEHSNIRTIDLRIVSDHFGAELEKDWAWCDVLVLPTLSENFGLVVAEALERGKRVITTDGAPAWGEGELFECSECSNVRIGYGGRLVYLKGYRDGTDEKRVRMLRCWRRFQVSSFRWVDGVNLKLHFTFAQMM